MWLCDLEKAIKELREVCPDYVFTKVEPASSGIMFYTTHHTRVLWRDGGQTLEHCDDGEIKILKNFS